MSHEAATFCHHFSITYTGISLRRSIPNPSSHMKSAILRLGNTLQFDFPCFSGSQQSDKPFRAAIVAKRGYLPTYGSVFRRPASLINNQVPRLSSAPTTGCKFAMFSSKPSPRPFYERTVCKMLSGGIS